MQLHRMELEQPRFVVIWDNVSFPPGCSGPGLVHKPQYLYSFVLAPLFPISQSHWGIIFSLALESVWPPIMPTCLFYKQWKRHAETLTWGQSWVGYDMQGDISPVAWTGKISLVMWMKWCGQMQTVGKIPKPPPHLYICLSHLFLLLNGNWMCVLWKPFWKRIVGFWLQFHFDIEVRCLAPSVMSYVACV